MADESENSVKPAKPAAPRRAPIELPSRANNPVSMTSAAISPPRATTKTARIDNALAREVELLAKKKLQDEEDRRNGVKRLTDAQRAETERRRQIQLTAILGFAILASVAIIFFAVLEKSRSERLAERPPVQTSPGTPSTTAAANRRPLAVGYYPAVSPYSSGVVRQTFPQPYGGGQQVAVQRPVVSQPATPVQPATTAAPSQDQTQVQQPAYYAPPPPVQQGYGYPQPVPQQAQQQVQPTAVEQATPNPPSAQNQEPVQQAPDQQNDGDQAPPLPPPAGN